MLDPHDAIQRHAKWRVLKRPVIGALCGSVIRSVEVEPGFELTLECLRGTALLVPSRTGGSLDVLADESEELWGAGDNKRIVTGRIAWNRGQRGRPVSLARGNSRASCPAA